MNSQLEPGLTTARIEALTDGIFAFAMTLLVLNLQLPETSTLRGVDLHELLLVQFENFFSYVLSFVLLALFWINHHRQSHFIKHTNQLHLWINIFILMFIVLIPFSASLVSNYADDWMAELFFASNFFIVGMLLLLNWWYAAAGHRLIDKEIDEKRIIIGIKRGAVTPFVSALAIIAALVYPPLCSYLYLLIPVLLFITYFRS